MLVSKLIRTESNVMEIVNGISLMPYNKNKGFETWEGLTGVRKPEALSTICVHNTLVKQSRMTKWTALQAAQIHAKNHINSKAIHKEGEPSFPYHFYCGIDGTIIQCNSLLAKTYGVASNNNQTIHIGIEGDFRTDVLNDKQRNAIYSLIITLLSMKDELPNLESIVDHNQLKPKNCSNLDMNKIRADIEKIEMDLSLNESDKEIMARVFAIASRISSLYNTAVGETKYAPIARDYLLSLEQPMRSMGILK